MLYQMKCR